jgi:hypothetical protein
MGVVFGKCESMEMAFLIDITEKRFKIPLNQAVIEYIWRQNPFAHSDIGDKLIEVAKRRIHTTTVRRTKVLHM